jgi:glucose-6-phosphate isomerase
MSADTVTNPIVPDITETPAWGALARHHDQISGKHLREFFAEDPTAVVP